MNSSMRCSSVFYSIAVPIGKTCSKSLMRFNRQYFLHIALFHCWIKQVFTVSKSFNINHWNCFLTYIVNKANGIREETKYLQKQILDLAFLFTVQNVASGYTLCHLENCFILLYVCFKIMIWKNVVSPINWNIEKTSFWIQKV